MNETGVYTMTMQPKYLWIDLETTGLDPLRDVILECAAVITGPDLEPIERLHAVLHVASPQMSDFVREMHTKNGLLDEVRAARLNVLDLDECLIGIIDGYGWADGKPIIAGSTISFDRSFLRPHCPDTHILLHYRQLDVSSCMMLCNDLGAKFPKAEAHRAMPDILESIENAKRVRAMLRVV